GDAELGARFSEERTRILQAPLPAGSEREVHRIRLRMEGELARETSQRHDFKTGSGGLLDVETVVQLHQLRYARSYPELLDTCTIEAQLDRLDQRGLLAPEDADTLRRGWEFLQRLSSRLRIVENRSISDLDEERGDLDSVARALGYTSPQRRGGARRALLEDYRRHTTAVRAVYRRVVGN
ncbi:MAG TPA: hypothetical protein VEB21_14345, partial [Terriglobales bacterium]|nr:hypothetical protein [Terriglobales bacterium]